MKIVDYCLALPYSKRVQLMAALKDSILEDAAKPERRNPKILPRDRGEALLSAMGKAIGEPVNLNTRRPLHAWAKAMVAYQLLEEGYTTKDAALQIGKDHSTLSYMRNKMRFALDHPYAYEDVIYIWKRFKKQIDETDN